MADTILKALAAGNAVLRATSLAATASTSPSTVTLYEGRGARVRDRGRKVQNVRNAVMRGQSHQQGNCPPPLPPHTHIHSGVALRLLYSKWTSDCSTNMCAPPAQLSSSSQGNLSV